MARCIVLLGPPGAGKGTQAKSLARQRNLEHVSTGDLLRSEIASGSELGRRVQATVEAGRLVPDEVVAELVAARLDRGGDLLLDGFPRTVAQARVLGDLLDERKWPAPRVVALRVDDDEVVRRLAARRTCPSCGPQAAAEDCVQCGAALLTRPDDAEGVVRERLSIYAAQTVPLMAYYASLGQLAVVDGSGAPGDVARRIEEVVPA